MIRNKTSGWAQNAYNSTDNYLPCTPEVLCTPPQSLGILSSYSPGESCNAANKEHVNRELFKEEGPYNKLKIIRLKRSYHPEG